MITQKGFSLLEIAIAIAIIGILLYGVAGSLNKVDDFETYQKNQKYLEKVEKALFTFAQVNRFLPCPDTDFDGREDRLPIASDGICRDKDGSIPYLDIGIERNDAWGSPLYYAVNNQVDNNAPVIITDPDESASYFSNLTAPQPSYDYNTPPFGSDRGAGNYRVCLETAADCSAATADADVIEFAAIAVVISFGKNGNETWQRRNDGTENQLSASEEENADDDNFFWQAQGSNLTEPARLDFDDQLFWVTGYDMKFAVIKSGGDLPDIP